MARKIESSVQYSESSIGDEKTTSESAVANTVQNFPQGINIDIDTKNDTILECWAELGGAGTINVYASRDRINWRLTDTNVLGAAGVWHGGYFNAYRYIRLQVPTVGISVVLEITSK